MFDLTTLDYIYIIVVLVSTIWATMRGGVYETIATLSWVIAAVTARFASPILDGWLQDWFKLSESTVGTLVASYFVVFFVILITVGFFNQKLRDKIQDSIMNLTDKTLGVIFGIVRGVVVMGVVYWGALWYYSDAPRLPRWLDMSRMRPVMHTTAELLDKWFIPGTENRLLARDRVGMEEKMKIYNNLINPAVSDRPANTASGERSGADAPKKPAEEPAETGYKTSERTALENQLMQIESAAKAAEARESANQGDQND